MKNWIPIKTDYLIDNFENLLESLADADFDASDDGVLNESVMKLEDVSNGLLSDYFSHESGVENKSDSDFERNIRIVLASIIASHRINRRVNELIVSLLDSLVVNNIYQGQSNLEKIKTIAVNLAMNREIKTIPFSFRDLQSDRFDFKLFKFKLLLFEFNDAGEDKVGFEGKGSCLFEGKRVEIRPSNLTSLSAAKFRPIIDLDFDITVTGEGKKLSDEDFKEQTAAFNRLTQAFKKVKPLPEKRLKAYSYNQTFFVKVKEVSFVRGLVSCITLDPDYEPLELNLDLSAKYKFNPFYSLTRSDIVNSLKEGTILNVSLIEKSDKQYFSLSETLYSFFNNVDNFTGDYAAIFIQDYPGGTRWLTEMGHTVNIKDNDTDEEIREAAEEDCDLSIEVKNINSNIDKNGNPVMNAFPTGAIFDEESHDKFKREISRNLMEYLQDCWMKDCPEFRPVEKPIALMQAIYPSTLGHLLSVVANDSSSPFMERFHCASVAKLLAVLAENAHDEVFCEFTLTYLRALWAFARDPGHNWLTPLNIPEELTEIPTALYYKKVIDILSEYKYQHHLYAPISGNLIDLERLRNLVDASNALSGNISETEINRVKRTISRFLGVESIYKEETSDKYWFGEESEMLEFKTSIVFPPSESRADPDKQIWQILKTINGFFNSLHGGTLLIGVNDFGNASGLDDDIQWLYANHQIAAPDIDKYKLYIKMRVDHAFKAFKRNDEDADITSTRLRYSSEQRDAMTVVRIDILPFEFGCIKIKDKLKMGGIEIHRPVGIREAYIRTANATEELTPVKRQKIESEKRKIIKDIEQQKFIVVQEAIESAKYVELKGYQSYRGESDRIVAPLELLPLRGLLVAFPKGEKDLRVYKLNRCESVEITEEGFKRENPLYSVDPFNMLAMDSEVMSIRIRLDRLGWLLIREMYPYTNASGVIREDDTDEEFPYLLDCQIADIKGIGAFCMSILGHFKIVDGQNLADHILSLIDNYQPKS